MFIGTRNYLALEGSSKRPSGRSSTRWSNSVLSGHQAPPCPPRGQGSQQVEDDRTKEADAAKESRPSVMRRTTQGGEGPYCQFMHRLKFFSYYIACTVKTSKIMFIDRSIATQPSRLKFRFYFIRHYIDGANSDNFRKKKH